MEDITNTRTTRDRVRATDGGTPRGLLEVDPETVTVEWPAIFEGVGLPQYAPFTADVRAMHDQTKRDGATVVMLVYDRRRNDVSLDVQRVSPEHADVAGANDRTPLSSGGQVFVRELPDGGIGRGDEQLGGHADAVVLATEVCPPEAVLRPITNGAPTYTEEWAPSEVFVDLPDDVAPVESPDLDALTDD